MRIQKGYVFRRYNFWYVRYHDDVMENGVVVRRQISTRLAPVNEEYSDKRSVQALADIILAPVNAGETDPQSTMQVSEFITNIYLPKVKEKHRRSTYKNYSDIARLHVVPRLGKITLRKFRTCDAERLLADIAKKATNKEGLPLSHSTLERVKTFLSGTFKTAKRLGARDGENPVRDSETPNGTAAKKTYAYCESEIRAILSVLDEPARTVVLLAAHSGLRKGEIEGLLWKDYDGRTLNIQRAMWNGFTQAPKTETSTAPVPVTRQLAAALEAHRERLGETWARDGFPIFQSEVHTPLNLANLVKRVIVPALEVCEVCRKPKAAHKPEAHLFSRDKSIPKWFGWHALRRGLATNLHKAGVQDKTIQNILRHSNVRVTLDSYIKSLPETTISAMTSMGEKLEGDKAPEGDHAPHSAPLASKTVN
jgi:integrase